MNRQWLYAKQPQGKIGADTFEWTETAIPVPRDGEALVQTRMLSLDPANRAWMMGKTYRDALGPGQVMSGFVIGEVVESKTPGFAKGDIVEGDWGWQDYAAMPARRLTKRMTDAPLEMLIGPLSVTGLTAYFGLLEVGQPKPGDTVLVSAAAGAVGSMVVSVLLEERGARTALIATRGFADMLEIARQDRSDLYRLCAPKPEPLVDRELRFELAVAGALLRQRLAVCPRLHFRLL